MKYGIKYIFPSFFRPFPPIFSDFLRFFPLLYELLSLVCTQDGIFSQTITHLAIDYYFMILNCIGRSDRKLEVKSFMMSIN